MPLKFNPLALEAIKNGIPLVGEKLFTGLRNAFDEMERRGLKKTKVTWTSSFPLRYRRYDFLLAEIILRDSENSQGSPVLL